jgi:ribosome-binding protein aMBF1 (putative translation factor)
MDKGGKALKRAIHVARARAGIASDMELSQRAGVHYDTLMNWYSGRTVPRPAEVRKVAEAVDIPLVVLMDAYEGRDPEPMVLQDAISELVGELRKGREQNDRLLAELVRIVERRP